VRIIHGPVFLNYYGQPFRETQNKWVRKTFDYKKMRQHVTNMQIWQRKTIILHALCVHSSLLYILQTFSFFLRRFRQRVVSPTVSSQTPWVDSQTSDSDKIIIENGARFEFAFDLLCSRFYIWVLQYDGWRNDRHSREMPVPQLCTRRKHMITNVLSSYLKSAGIPR